MNVRKKLLLKRASCLAEFFARGFEPVELSEVLTGLGLPSITIEA